MIDQKQSNNYLRLFLAKENNCGKYLILLVTLLCKEEVCLSPLTLLKIGLSRQFCSKKLLQIRKNTFHL